VPQADIGGLFDHLVGAQQQGRNPDPGRFRGLQTQVLVGQQMVTVRGNVIEDVARIGTAFIP
jgi:hypothetical protein